MTLVVPSGLKREHEELHAELERAIEAGGQTGEAAQAVARLLHGHFKKEEAYALPPLSLLSTVMPDNYDNDFTEDMDDALRKADNLRRELPCMLEEHKRITQGLQHLAQTARAESKPQFAEFAQKVMAHAQEEEEIFYPAVLLLGDHLAQRLARAKPSVWNQVVATVDF